MGIFFLPRLDQRATGTFGIEIVSPIQRFDGWWKRYEISVSFSPADEDWTAPHYRRYCRYLRSRLRYRDHLPFDFLVLKEKEKKEENVNL